MGDACVLGITGASGAPYAVRLLEVLLASGTDVLLSISPAGAQVLKQELGLEVDLDRFDAESLVGFSNQARHEGPLRLIGADPRPAYSTVNHVQGQLRYFHFRDLMVPIASGSALTRGMVVCPCSGGTLSAVAHGNSGNLIQRAAEVHLKERRTLILVPRETPLSLVMLKNMQACAQAGAIILPAMPGYYQQVTQLSDLVDFVVARICDQLKVPHQLGRRWGADESC